MDLLTVDVTNIKDAKVLDKAILFSKEHSIDKWSQKTEQSHYELLLHLGDRFKRTYKEI
jgi:alanine racemase